LAPYRTRSEDQPGHRTFAAQPCGHLEPRAADRSRPMVTQGTPEMDAGSRVAAGSQGPAGSLAGLWKSGLPSVHAGICSRMATMGPRRQCAPAQDPRNEHEMKAHHRGRRGSQDRRPSGSRRDEITRSDVPAGRQHHPPDPSATSRAVTRGWCKQNGHVLIRGTWARIQRPSAVTARKNHCAPPASRKRDLVEIGDYDLGLQGKLEAYDSDAGRRNRPPADESSPWRA